MASGGLFFILKRLTPPQHKDKIRIKNRDEIYSHEFSKGESIYLGINTMVFQAEVTAITVAGIEIIKQVIKTRKITFM